MDGMWLFASGATDWLAALGTVGAVLVALFLQLARPWWRRPQLELLPYDPSPETGDRSLVRPGDKPPARAEDASLWFRLRVTNKGHGSPARNAQVTVVRTRCLDPVLEPGAVIPTRPLKWADVPAASIEIPAGVTRHLDVASVRRQPGSPANGRLRLELYPRDDNDIRHWLKTGRYELDLVVSADDMKPLQYRQALAVELSEDDEATELFDRGFNPLGSRGKG